MYIRLKTSSATAPWRRISYATYCSKYRTERHLYDARPEPDRTDKQVISLARGRVLRYIMASQAQLRLATDAVAAVIDIESDQYVETAGLLNELHGLTSLCHAAVTKATKLYGNKDNQSKGD